MKQDFTNWTKATYSMDNLGFSIPCYFDENTYTLTNKIKVVGANWFYNLLIDICKGIWKDEDCNIEFLAN
jgi:hypothetical protein